ncbi:MAG: class I SAM-dependent methyltransferase [Gammaproteobacteria bacterium]|nr:class I SAM-dependent methyltransferase [Gammaproteobacteria bacterium]
MLPDITIYCADLSKQQQARDFADTYHYPYSEKKPESAIYLCFTESGLSLHDSHVNSDINIDFTSGGLAHRLQYGGGKGQTIAKAVGISSKNKPHVLDATAGLGRDALILANLGLRLSLIEQSPLLAEMLKQAIADAADNPLFQKASAEGFELYHDDASIFMNQRKIDGCDVVYLDPMYPEKKKSALVKKDMQILQNLIGHSAEADNAALLAAAIKFARQRVVVKRPKNADNISGPTPTLSLHSKKTRYDIYVISTLT